MAEPGNEPLVTVAPEFFVRDPDAAVRFYVEKLGFSVIRQDSTFAVVALGPAFVLLAGEAAVVEHKMPRADEWLAGAPRGAGVNIRIIVDDVDAMYERCRAGGVCIVWEIADKSYGLRDFITADATGYLLRFAAPVAR